MGSSIATFIEAAKTSLKAFHPFFPGARHSVRTGLGDIQAWGFLEN